MKRAIIFILAALIVPAAPAAFAYCLQPKQLPQLPPVRLSPGRRCRGWSIWAPANACRAK